MTFLEILEKTLLQDERFIAEDGKVLKAKVYDAAMAMDEDLLHLLLSEQVLKGHFFKKVNDTLIFDKVEFTWVLNSREFLPDSYTMYKNKIGLVDSSGDLISQKQDVTLVWPYKDCVLEGGQTKDDEKRDEVFYNEALAPDQVTRLLYPKALTNAKRYSYVGDYDLTGKAVGGEGTVTCEETTEFLDDDNLIVKGNNLLALSSLLRRYEGKVKLIYIDPPYNTNSDSFRYNDKFSHSTWMTFMKNRLEISYRLLSNEGVIFMQCDDNEQAYLSVLAGEVFGRENHVATLPTIMNLKGNQDQFGFAGTHEYILVFAKEIGNLALNDLNVDDPDELDEWEKDSVGFYKKGANLKATGTNAPRSKRPNLFYPIYINKKNELNFERTNLNDYELLPITNGEEMSWRWQKSTMKKNLNDIIVVENNGEFSLYKKQRPELGDLPTKRPKSIFYKPEYSSGNGTNQIKEMFGDRVFSFAKPEELICDIITIATDERDLVLDFFMGSATTQAVALKMNRRFIGIEQMDYINTVSVPRLCKVIEGEQGGVSKDVNWSGGGSFVYCELAERSETLMKGLQSAKDSDSILAILDEATEKGLLRPSVLPDDLKKTREDFLEFSLDEQRRLVMELLDKNKLYVNLCDMEDENMGLSENSRAFTRGFYNLDKDTEV
jgi:adenine-specific DNA-methyltransferase